MSSSEKHDQLKEKHKQHTNNECSESSETCASAKCEPINNNLDNDIQIELVEEKDAAGVLKLLKDYFFKVSEFCNVLVIAMFDIRAAMS